MLDAPLRLGIIPARALSTRFPLKMLAKIGDKPLIQHVWDAASRSRLLSELVVATDDLAILKVVEAFGGRAVMTSVDFTSGTDRVASVASKSRAEIVVNLQGDEPLLPPSAIDRLIEALEADPHADIATLAVRKEPGEEFLNPNVVKVVTDSRGNALYFSRAALKSGTDGHFNKHVGIYAFRKKAIERFCLLPPSSLEQTERLEQLRALQDGMRIKVVFLDRDTVAVDAPEDVQKVEERLRAGAVI